MSQKLGKGDFEGALAGLNSLSISREVSDDPDKKTRIASMVADIQFRQGRFEEALEYFEAAQKWCSFPTAHASSRHWLDCALGEFRCLLRLLRLEKATGRVERIVETARMRVDEFESLLSGPPAGFPLLIPSRPWRLSVVHTKIATVYHTEGYPEPARWHYEQALTPRGASRARLGLARLGLAEGKPEDAEKLAYESLSFGKFRAETLATWPIYIEARLRQNKSGLDDSVLARLKSEAPASVRDRALLLITRTLRAHGDHAWRMIAEDFVNSSKATDEIISVEMSKILLAEDKLNEPEADSVALAGHRLLRQNLAPNELVAVSKTIIGQSLRADRGERSFMGLKAKIARLYDAGAARNAVHGMALAAMEASRHDLARQWLTEQIAELALNDPRQGLDRWALARMEEVLGNKAEAAGHYLKIARLAVIPARFRLQAFTNWFSLLPAEDVESRKDELLGDLETVLGLMEGYRPLLDAGRQLRLAGSALDEITDRVIREAETRAWHAFQAESNPRESIRILLHLARRQYYDFGRKEELLRQFDSLGPERIEALWSEQAVYWEYLALVMRCKSLAGNHAAATALAESQLDHPATPKVGILHLASALGEMEAEAGNLEAGLVRFAQAAQASPASPLAAPHYYWSALRGLARRDKAAAIVEARALRQCFSLKPAYHWQWALDARALLILEDAGEPRREAEPAKYTPAYLNRQRQALARDLEKIRNITR